jgi:signal transduction histidine kinase
LTLQSRILFLVVKSPLAIRNLFLYLFVFFVCLLRLPAAAQVSFFYNETPVADRGDMVLAYADTSHDRSLQRYEKIKSRLSALDKDEVNLSYKDEMLWLWIPVRFFGEADKIQNIMVRNPHINFLGAWLFQNDSLRQRFNLTGDHLPFAARASYYPDYIFPLPEKNKSSLSLLLLIDKRNEQLNIPIHALSVNGLSEYNRKKNLLAGLITGLSLFLFLFSLFLYYNMREQLYVYYGLYILAAFTYIFSDYGYLFMYFFPHHPAVADFTRPFAITLATPLYMMFALKLLDVRRQLPTYYSWCMRYLLLYGLLFIGCLFFLSQTGIIRLILVLLMQFFQSLTTLIIFFVALAGWRKKISYAAYIMASSTVLLLSFFGFMLFVSGYVPDTFFTRNLMNIGFSAELSILAFVLTLRFKNYKVQLEKMLRQVNLEQEQIFKSISDYQEKEMQRFSSLLHDSVGARLSSIRLNLESASTRPSHTGNSEKIQHVIQDIGALADEVRAFSHNLSPLLLQEKGLVDSIRQISERVNQSGELFIQFESIGSQRHVSYRYELMIYNILQELIQNIIKHAGASEVIIQLMMEPELISIFVEDNGEGFEKKLHKDGLGFSQIRQLIKFVRGNFYVESSPGNGCRVSIEFPVLPDEIDHPYHNR